MRQYFIMQKLLAKNGCPYGLFCGGKVSRNLHFVTDLSANLIFYFLLFHEILGEPEASSAL